MQIARSANELRSAGRKACLAIGFFDGVHLGHQQIIRQAVGDARQHDSLSVVATFDAHPATVVAPDRAPRLIQSLNHRLRTIESQGPDAVLLLHFDRAFSEMTGEAFIRHLHASLPGIHSVCVGSDFHFGHRRSGNVALLQRLGTELGFVVHGISAVAIGDQSVSSTRIRGAIASGDFDTASQLLGRPCSIAGNVIRGAAVGRSLGFPTANLDVTGLVLPPRGVYASQALVNGQPHRAVVNLGTRPTFSADTTLHLEAHLLDFSGDFYGQELELIWVGRIRGEQRFENKDALIRQIQQDVRQARSMF